jgi:hypothetical protein
MAIPVQFQRRRSARSTWYLEQGETLLTDETLSDILSLGDARGNGGSLGPAKHLGVGHE